MASPPGNAAYVWGNDDCWDALGARPSGPSFWRYRTISSATNGPDDITDARGINTDARRWFYVEAQSDIDGDGSDFTQVLSDNVNATFTINGYGD